MAKVATDTTPKATMSSRRTAAERKPAKTTSRIQTLERKVVSRRPAKKKLTSHTPPKPPKADEPVSEGATQPEAAPKSKSSTGSGSRYGRRAPRRSSKPARQEDSISKVLSKPWNEDTARKILSEGFLASLAIPLRSTIPPPEIDAEELRERLKDIRKVLAEECMVQDDVTDVIVLDATMNALADRIDVYRIRAENGDLKDIEQMLDLRYKADRRLIDAVASLKNP